MSPAGFTTRARKGAALAATAVLATIGFAAAPVDAQQTSEIVITIKSINALDKVDAFSKADFFARITIAGETINTNVIKQADWSNPRWQVTKKVPRGTHKVNVQILDKDLTKDDPIDVNPRKDQPKRDLDFTVSTPGCGIGGLTAARCGQNIKRGGDEKKSAEIVFTVDVKR